jgi:AcrR family transcriptional regulator
VAQYLKDDIRARIDAAALRVFAARGFDGATVAAIARQARTSTGNVYHYYRDKTTLFNAVVPDAFARRLMSMVRARVKALDGVTNVAALGAAAPFHALAEDLLAFSIENRLRVIILLRRPAGTRHASFPDNLVRLLQRLAIAHFRGLDRAAPLDGARRFALDQVYRNWAGTMTAILEQFDEEPAIRAAVAAYSRYHLAGLNHLLGG